MIVFILFSLIAIIAGASDVEPGPILLPSVNSHESAVSSIVFDESRHEVITASWDGSLIRWNAESGEFRSRILLPRSNTELGRIESLAINPRTRLVATGGRSTIGSMKGYTLFFVDLANSSIVAQRSFEHEIKSLAFSKDGDCLAVLSEGTPSLHLFLGQDFTRGMEITLPDGPRDARGTAIAWSPDGRLAFASAGSLYILERESSDVFKVSKATKLSGSANVTRMAWSTESTLLALAYGTVPSIELRNSDTLDPIAYPDISGVFKDIYSIHFSEAGGKLLAGGQHSDGDGVKIRIWTKNGLGSHKDLTASGDTVFSLVSAKDGTVYFGSAEPAWGLVTPDDTMKYWPAGRNIDLRSSREALAVNVDATIVQFDKNIKPFSIISRTQSDFGEKLYPSASPRKLEYKRDDNSLFWGSNQLDLPPHSMPISYSSVFDGKALLVGCDVWLCLYAKDGRRIWAVPAPYVWGLTVSGNEAVVVAGLGDGTIRWYAIDNGDLLLSGLPSAQDDEWLIWNPEGPYAAGHALDQVKKFGWITQKSSNEVAVFHKADEFRERFEKPDEVLSKLWRSEGIPAVPYSLPVTTYTAFIALAALLFLLALPGYILGWFPLFGILSGFENRKKQVIRTSLMCFFLTAFMMAFPFLLKPVLMNGGQLSRAIALDFVPAYWALKRHALFDSIMGVGAWLIPAGISILVAFWSYRMLFDTREKSSPDGKKSEREHIFEFDSNAWNEMRKF